MLPLLPWPDGMKTILEGQYRVSLGSVEFEGRGSGDDLLRVRIPQNALGLERQMLAPYISLKEYKPIIFLLIVVPANGRQEWHHMCQGYDYFNYLG